MVFSIIAAQLRGSRRAARPTSPVTLSQSEEGAFAHQGHRLDLPDERLISHREARYYEGVRRVWNGRLGMWVVAPEPLKKSVAPQPKAAPRVVEAVRGSEDRVLMSAVRAVVDEGGRPEEVMVRIIEPRP